MLSPIMLAFLREIKTPWTFAVVVMATAVAVFLTSYGEIPKAAFQFSVILIGGFTAKALIAVMIGAMRTTMLMVFASLLLAVSTIVGTDAAAFKDAAVEGMLSYLAGGLVVLIGAMLERHQPRREVPE